MFAGGMAGEQLARLRLESQRALREETIVQGLGRIRDVRQGPDGSISLAIDHRGDDPTPVVRLEPVASN
jgi:glucose/arabinose dehydrogenase